MSGEFKGTPGPWMAVQQYVDEVSVIDGGGFKVVTAERTAVLMDWDKKGLEHWGDEGGSRHLSGPEQFSNAYLIAAAPDLLEALQECLPWVNNDLARGAHFKALSAINKALGKKQ
ncbi:hypothetical protein Q6301_20335 [Klebsiella quasipneumoniae]|uniref:hypothetical protein n=1 Tax=Klebsiella quasipneumoniae TaxID=1463165 RepID=UPI002732232B|nr:hypothetical protein [Klebsiella quasipneumoniae]MDP1297926.1 hypothetical protein [Klebsiella quasipneumoniae]